MTTTVAVIAAGEMGCSIGDRLRRHGARVLTSLAHRSAATVERATLAGLIVGLRAQSTGGPIGAASALKMAYAGLNKGLTALAAAMALAATRAGAANALREELAYSQPQLLAHIGRSLPDMYPKAHRWEFEMREVAAFAGEDSSTAPIFEGIADLYLQLAKDWKAKRQVTGAIDDFLAAKRS